MNVEINVECIHNYSNKLKSFQISDLKRSMHVGGHLPAEDPFAKTKFEPVADIEIAFSIKLDSNGLFESVKVPSGMPIFQKNIVKGWANQLQINSGKIKESGFPTAFKSEEVNSCLTI